jgi:hypothetical protein
MFLQNLTATVLLRLYQGGYGILLILPIYDPPGLIIEVVRPEYVARKLLARNASFVAAFATNAEGAETLIFWNGADAVGPFASMAQLAAMNLSHALVWCSTAQLEGQQWNICEVQPVVVVTSFSPVGVFLVALFVFYVVFQLVVIIVFCTWQKQWEKREAAAALQAAKEANHLNLGHEVRLQKRRV